MRPRLRVITWVASWSIAVSVCGCHAPSAAAPSPAGSSVRAPAAQASGGANENEAPPAASYAATYSRYAVVSGHPQASAAGAEILAEGGNAADAAVATMLALGVASPASSGLGGGGFALYYDAHARKVTFIDFRERAPASARPDMFQAAGGKAASEDIMAPVPGVAVGVPGEPRGMQMMLERLGTMSRAQVAAPAIRLAEQGFHPEAHGVAMMTAFAADLRDDSVGRRWIGEKGPVKLAPDATLKNPDLAATLREFAASGAKPFYEGHIARDIVAAVDHAGGHMTMGDLRSYAVDARAPLKGRRFGFQWVTAPPESAGGFTLLMSLGLLERWQPKAGQTPWTDVGRLHAFAESFRGPFIDRARYFGDPRFVDVPVDALLAPDRMAKRAAAFQPERATDPAAYDLPLPGKPGSASPAPPEHGTSDLCVVDAAGDVAAVTTTVNWPFGLRDAVDGFWINNELDDFTREPKAPAGAPAWDGSGTNLARPGHRPVSTMVPTIVFDGAGRPVLCIGASGGTKIVTAVVQVAYRIAVLGEDPAHAVPAPRIHASDHGPVSYETSLPPATVHALEAEGYTLQPMQWGANVQAIRIRWPTSVQGGGHLLDAASDPRKGGRPAGQ